MKKSHAILTGIAICLLLSSIITAITYRNRIYAWTLGDVNSLYAEAKSLYDTRKFNDARPLFQKLADIDSASYSQYLLGDMYYRGLGMDSADYTKAFMLFVKSANNNNTDAHNNLV